MTQGKKGREDGSGLREKEKIDEDSGRSNEGEDR